MLSATGALGSMARNRRVSVTATRSLVVMAARKSKGCIKLLLASYFFEASINKVNHKNRHFLRVTLKAMRGDVMGTAYRRTFSTSYSLPFVDSQRRHLNGALDVVFNVVIRPHV